MQRCGAELTLRGRPSADGRAAVQIHHGIFRILLTFFILVIGYETMVGAFHLLNEPSDRAVYEGMAVLALLCVSLPVLLLRLWRRV
jgi:hypothetical protein